MTVEEDHPSKNLVKRIRDLRSKKGREEYGTFLAEGPKVLEEVIRSSLPVRTLFFSREFSQSEDCQSIRSRIPGADVWVLSDRNFDRVSPTSTPQGVLAEAEIPTSPKLPEGLSDSSLVMVLDEVQDPGNVGTAIRSAAALGVEAVLLTLGCADVWNPKTVRATAGASLTLPIYSDLRPEEILEWLTTVGSTVWIATLEGKSIHEIDPPLGPLSIVFGNESRGPRPDWGELREFDEVSLPMSRGVDSLNVGVTVSAFLSLIREKRFRSHSDSP